MTCFPSARVSTWPEIRSNLPTMIIQSPPRDGLRCCEIGSAGYFLVEELPPVEMGIYIMLDTDEIEIVGFTQIQELTAFENQV
mmetsp:Transcript_48288/g.55586  ORF Transcript_48288/g.55586 Transcript_48288/m.55586 type:complete len:83 (+) Transcript_48288:453-701(+)